MGRVYDALNRAMPAQRQELSVAAMKVFISWSGERSNGIAQAMYDWLPSIIQAVQPWMSDNDIDKGTRWRAGLAEELEQASVGIICLTPENLESPWINFEAGALSKQQKRTHVCTLLFEVDPIDLREPLAQFQATKTHREDIRKLVGTINGVLGPSSLADQKLGDAFDVWWPKLEARFTQIPAISGQSNRQRDVREVLEEILELVRSQTREANLPWSPLERRLEFPKNLKLTLEDAQILNNYFLSSMFSTEQMLTDEKSARSILKTIKEDPQFLEVLNQWRLENVLRNEKEEPIENSNP